MHETLFDVLPAGQLLTITAFASEHVHAVQTAPFP
jgi:hypothetical protein